MSLVTMFGVSRVPNTLHWMGSQQPRVLDGGRSVVNLLSLVFFAAYCQWHNIILAEWLHFTDIRAESTLLFSDFWWFVQIRANQYPLMSVVPSLAGHGSGRCRDARWLHYRGRGGYCGHWPALTIHFSSQWPHTFAFITSSSRHNTALTSDKWQPSILEQVSNIVIQLWPFFLSRYELWRLDLDC